MLFPWDSPVGAATGDPGQRTARTHDRVKQPARRLAVAKFEAVRDKRLDSEMVRQRPKNVFEKLPDQDDALAVAYCFEQVFGGLAAQLRLQDVVKVLFAEKIQAIAADPPQQNVQE